MTNNNGWIEWKWTPERPYPESFDTLVYIKCLSDGYEEDDTYYPSQVQFWRDDEGNDIWEPNQKGSITHYRLASGGSK